MMAVLHKGAISSKRVHGKVDGKHYYDCTVHFMRIKVEKALQNRNEKFSANHSF